MKIHDMNLQPRPFAMIRCGKKDIELRLDDERRRDIAPGDMLRFHHPEGPILEARVVRLHRFPSFAALYASLPLLRCGYTEEELPTAHPRDMELYYPPEKQAKYGVLGIEIALLSPAETD